MSQYKLQIAELLVRFFTAILFVFQGYDKLFRIKMEGVIATFKADAFRFHIPNFALTIVAYCTSIIEFLGGILLLAGFCTTFTLTALGLDLLLVSFAFTYMQPMWDMKYVFPRFLLIIFLLVIPNNYQLFSLDEALRIN